MNVISIFDRLLSSMILCCGLLLFMCCSDEGDRMPPVNDDEEIQPARLIKARYYNRKQDSLDIYPLPLNGRGVLAPDSIIELVFDKSVLLVSINYAARAQPDKGPPATVWKLETDRLKEVWYHLVGWNPGKDVTLTIVYEDDIGIHKEALDVTLGDYRARPLPPMIDTANIRNNQVDVDANRLNREGIKITFTKQMDAQRTRIVVYHRFPNPISVERGQKILHWTTDWTFDARTNMSMATLLPKSEDDRLLPGKEYEVRLLALYDTAGNRRGPEESPLIIQFRTASEKQ